MNELLTIGLTGDVMLGRTLDTIITQRGYPYPWGNVLSLLQKTDINVINLETTFTTSEHLTKKTYNFKAAPDKIQSLIDANISIANLANNHILDFSSDGLIETIHTLDIAGIKHVGAGMDDEEASKAIVINKNNIRIGMLGATDNEPDWKADTSPGVNYIDVDREEDRGKIISTIEKLRSESDIIIVSIHWGFNMVEKPAAGFTQFAHAMIDHGANIIHGHSAHIVQGIECYNNNFILYDTGDFVDDYAVDTGLRNDLSAFFMLTLNKAGVVHLKFVPIRISNYQATLARDEDYAWVKNRINFLSSSFNTHFDEKNEIWLNTSSRNLEAESKGKPETNSYV